MSPRKSSAKAGKQSNRKSKRQQPAKRDLDAFISHASQDAKLATEIENFLEGKGLKVWLDRSELALGVLLRNELQAAIGNSRALILIWSKHAAASRWVAAELLTAFHLDRFIVPCVSDNSRLPAFLGASVFLPLRGKTPGRSDELLRAVRSAPNAANDTPPVMGVESLELQAAFIAIAQAQREMITQLMRRNLDAARPLQKEAETKLKSALARWKFEHGILNLAGFHYKNAYLLKHWDELQAGIPPPDKLLRKSEDFFFKALFANPMDPSALNGIGSVLILERELDAAEFFVRRAIAAIAPQPYPEAEHDLQLILSIKERQRLAAAH